MRTPTLEDINAGTRAESPKHTAVTMNNGGNSETALGTVLADQEEQRSRSYYVKKEIAAFIDAILLLVANPVNSQTLLLVLLLSTIRNDSTALAGYGLAATYFILTIITSVAFYFPVVNDTARHFSALKREETTDTETPKKVIAIALRNILLFSVAIITALLLFMRFSNDILTGMLGQPKAIADIAQSFLWPYSVCVIAPLCGVLGLNQLLIANADKKSFIVATLFNVPAVLLAYLLPTDAFGVLSRITSYAKIIVPFAISSWLTLASNFFILKRSHPTMLSDLYKQGLKDLREFIPFLKSGAIYSLQLIFDLISPFLMTVALVADSDKAQSAYAALFFAVSFIRSISVFLGIRSSVDISKAIGLFDDMIKSNNIIAAEAAMKQFFKEAFLSHCIGALITGLSLSAIMMTYPPMFADMNNIHDAQIRSTINQMAYPVSIFAADDFVILFSIFMGRAMHDSNTMAMARMINIVASIAVFMATAFSTKEGVATCWTGAGAMSVFAVLFALRIVQLGHRTKKEMEEKIETLKRELSQREPFHVNAQQESLAAPKTPHSRTSSPTRFFSQKPPSLADAATAGLSPRYT